jgi:hypothetical protein
MLTLSWAGTLQHLLQGSDDVSSGEVVVFCLISSLILRYVDLLGLLYKLPYVPWLSCCMQHTLSLVRGVGTADGRNGPCWKYRYKRQDVCSPFTVAPWPVPEQPQTATGHDDSPLTHALSHQGELPCCH